MDYNTQFINNINVKTDYYGAVVNIGSAINFSDGIISERYRIYPGIIAEYSDNNYAVLDRNLKDGESYKSDVDVKINNLNLSFSNIHKLSSYDAQNNIGSQIYAGTYYVSEVKTDGFIYDSFKLPLDISILDHLGSNKQCFIKIINKDSMNRVWKLTNDFLSTKYASCMLLGIYAANDSGQRINPNDVSGLNTNAHSVVMKFWNAWVSLDESDLLTSRRQYYKNKNITTFRDFIYHELTTLMPIIEITPTEKAVLGTSLYLNTNNLKCDNDKMLFEVNSVKYDIYRSSSEKITNLAFIDFGLLNERSGKLYVYSDKSINACKISGVGVADSRDKMIVMPTNKGVRNIVADVFRDLRYHSNYIYNVAVTADNVKSDVITVYNTESHTLQTYRIAHNDGTSSSSFFMLDVELSIGKNDSEEIARKLEDAVNKNEYITPAEYYGNALSFGEMTTGNSGYEKVSTDAADDISDWFWLDTLKNWCIFRQYTVKNTFKLYMWNGRNGWDAFDDVLAHPENYLYDINYLRFGINFSTTYKAGSIPISYKVVVLKYDSGFSQYVNDSFQTIRIGKMWSDNISGINRFPFSIGIPPVMRLASGEIGILYSLTISGATTEHPLIYPENIKFLNIMSKQYFGAGDDKTIADDWKRVEKRIAEPDTASVITSMNESTLVDADEINTVKDKASDVSLTFNPFKQYIETDNIDTDAYVERWN